MPDWTEHLTEEERAVIPVANSVETQLLRTVATLRALVGEKDEGLTEGASAWADYFRRTTRWDTGETPALVVRLEDALALTEDEMRERLEA